MSNPSDIRRQEIVDQILRDREEQERERQQYRYQSMELLNTVPPDVAAEALKLGKKYDLPREAVEPNLEMFRAQDRSLELEQMRRFSPKMMSWLDNMDNHAVARDEIDLLASMERYVKNAVEDPVGLQISTVKNVARSGFAGLLSVASTFDNLEEEQLQKAYDYYNEYDAWTERETKRKAEGAGGWVNRLGLTTADFGAISVPYFWDTDPMPQPTARLIDEAFDYNRSDWRRFLGVSAEGGFNKEQAITAIRPLIQDKLDAAVQKSRAADLAVREMMPSTGDFFADSLLAGVRTFTEMGPLIASAVATRGKTIPAVVMGGQVYYNQYSEGREQGLSTRDATNRAFMQAAIETLSERISLGIIDDMLQSDKGLVRTFATGMLKEQAQEQVATMGGRLVDWNYLERDKTLEEFIAETPRAMLETAIITAVASGGMQGTFLLADMVSKQTVNDTLAAQQSASDRAIGGLLDTAERMKLRERSPEKLKEAVDSIVKDTHVENVVVDLDGLTQALIDAGMDPNEVLLSMGVDASAIDTAAIVQGEVEVAMSTLLSSPVLGTARETVQAHLRLPGDTLTPAQKEAWNSTAAEYVQRGADLVRTQMDKDADLASKVRDVETQIFERLQTVGRTSAPVNRANAKLAARMAASIALRTGRDVNDVWAEIGPVLQADVTQLAQGAQGPGNGLPELFHGGRAGLTLADIQIVREPGATKQGKRNRVYGGFYGTSKLEEAQGYAEATEGSTVYRIELAPDAKVETKEGDVTRLSAQTIQEYRDRGVDVVVGKDPRGRTEYVVINKDAITGLVDTRQEQSGTVTQDAGPLAADLPGSPQWEAAVAKGLDMSTEARMARAEEQGFTIEAFRGVRVAPGAGELTDAQMVGGGWFAATPETANTYAADVPLSRNKGLTMKARLKFDNPLVIDAGGQMFDRVPGAAIQGLEGIDPKRAYTTQEIARLAEQQGFDGVEFQNIKADRESSRAGTQPGTIWYAANPANIRSVNAAFDPDQAASADLLAQDVLYQEGETEAADIDLSQFKLSDRQREISQMILDGATYVEIEEVLGLTRMQLASYIKEARKKGVPLPKQAPIARSTVSTLPQQQDLVIALFEEGVSQAEMGKLLGVDQTTVGDFIRKLKENGTLTEEQIAANEANKFRSQGQARLQEGSAFRERARGYAKEGDVQFKKFKDDRLSERDNKIVEMARNGASNLDMADEWDLSVRSVQSILTKARKLGIDVPYATTEQESPLMDRVLRLEARGLTATQTAEIIGTTPANVYDALKRAAEKGFYTPIQERITAAWHEGKRVAEIANETRRSPAIVRRYLADAGLIDLQKGSARYIPSPRRVSYAPSFGGSTLLDDKTLGQEELDGRAGTAGDGRRTEESRRLAPLEGAPNVRGNTGPDPKLVAVAEQYARDNGVPLKRQAEYVDVDPERAARIADAYDAMPHAPQDPAVQEAYANLIQQTLAQYRALEAAGYQFWFYDTTNDPYDGNPQNAMRDLRSTQSMAVFSTEAGYGSNATDLDVADNPMLADTGIEWSYGAPDGPKRRVLANDLFRAVHDAFGHGLEGASFRARGEENAWQAHVRLFTGSAIGAITSETRGQNSWLNYGPYAEANKTASVEDTVFADQKTGLMPEWTWTEGRAADMPDETFGQGEGLVSAAVRIGGKTYTGRNHDEAAQAARADGQVVDDINETAGFVDGRGKFLRRDDPEAVYAAIAAGQLDPARQRVIEIALRRGDTVTLTSDMLTFEEGQAGRAAPLYSGVRGQYRPSDNLLELTERADPSTFMHEMAHWYLHQVQMLASANDGWATGELAAITEWYESIKNGEQMQAIRARYRVVEEDGQFRLMYKNMRRGLYATEKGANAAVDYIEMQEAFAESFEQYLMTGKAPIPSLQDVFRQFKNWLVGIYKGLMPGQRVSLNPQIREVFDRMLAVDLEVDVAAAEAFRDAEEMAQEMFRRGIITARQLALVGDRLAKSKEEVKEELLSRVYEERMRKEETFWREERERIKGELTRQFDKSPLGRAFNWLAYGQWKDDAPADRGTADAPAESADVSDIPFTQEELLFSDPPGHGPVTPPTDLPPIRLNLGLIRELYGEEAVRRLPAAIRRRSSIATNIDDMLTTAETVRNTLRGRGPQTLTQWIMRRKSMRQDGTKEARKWGIKGADDELRNMGLERLINNKTGETIDYVREQAQEQGFITPEEGVEGQTTINQLLAALDREARDEPVIRASDVAEAQDRANAEQWLEWFNARGVDIYERNQRKLRAAMAQVIGQTDESLVSPDQAAEMFGFPTGEELLDALSRIGNKNDWLNTEADNAMAREYGDMMRDGSLQAEAMEAARLDVAGRQAEIEMEALARALGQQAASKYARELARERLDGQTVFEIMRYEKHLASERRFGQRALEAMNRGDLAAALKAKQSQLIAGQMYKEGKQRAEKIEKQRRDLLRYLDSEGRRNKIAPDYLERIDALLEGYELRSSKQAPGLQRRRMSAAEYAKEMIAAGRETELPAEVLLLAEGAQKERWRDLTSEEVEYLVATVQNIAHLGRTKQKLLDAQEQRRFDAIIDELAGTLEAAPTVKDRRQSFSPTPLETTATWLRKGHARLTRLEFEFLRLDGRENGPLWNRLWMPFAKAADVETARMRDAAVELRRLYNLLTPAQRSALFQKRVATPELGARRGAGMTMMDIVVIGLNWGNPGNRQALVEGYNWDADQVEAMLNRLLTDQHWDFIEGMWSLIGSYREDAFALEKSITGVEPKAVEGVTFTLANGRVIEGKYYPLSYSGTEPSALSVKQQKLDEAQMLSDMGKSYSKPMTRTGHLISRVGSGGKPVKLSINVAHEHVAAVIHDIAYRKAVIDVHRITGDTRFTEAYIAAAGKEQYDILRPWLAAIATERSEEPGGFATDIMRGARRNFSIMAMGFKIGTATQQLTGLLQSTTVLGPKYVAQGFAKAFTGGPASFWSAWDWVSQKSEFMRDRPMGFDRDVRQVTETTKSQTPLATMQRNAFLLIGIMDTAVSTSTWIGAYDRALDGNVKGIDRGDEDAAINYADSVVRRTQSSGRTQDLPQMMRGTELEKLLTVVYGFFSTLYNFTASQVLQVRAAQINPVVFTANMSLLYIVIPLIAAFLAGRIPLGEDEDEEERLALIGKELAGNAVGTVPFFRDVMSAVINPQYGYQMSPAGSVIEGAAVGLGGLARGEGFKTEFATRKSFETLGVLFGLPTSQLWITGDYVYDLAQGTEDPLADPVDGAREALLRSER